ncbi:MULTISPECIES: TonB-dependent siderophore receptor [unclassified Vibrio]|uniref:TonB-dependent siderophore receptor n=2 Tax=Vibrio TaxID=662 RepID=UPI0013617F4D|nr:TonB-dependent siderophore receptor [Vibrio sp. V36_P2S2PM302]NAX27427.1 TonB-dependent siderophore receptor [Vibrio sp. V38_P2S17PM301]
MLHARKTILAAVVRRVIAYGVAPIALVSHAFADEQEQPQVMETMVVTASALKVETPMEETPKAVSIVTEEDMAQRNPQKLDEALRYTSGVTSQPYGADNDTDWIKVRGFDAATYLDGSRLFKDGYYTWLLEPYGLERVELIKGPASILFGEAPPGGVVNAVQKKPTDVPQGELHLEGGNNNHQAVGFDISDYANDDGSVRYRLVGMLKNTDGELNGTETKRYYLAPSLAIDVSDNTQLTLLASVLHDEGVPTNGFFPAYGTIINTPDGKIDPSTNLGEPDYDKYERTQISVGYQIEHQASDVWTLSQNLNYAYNDLYLRSSYAFPSDTSTVVGRGIVFRDGHNNSFTVDNKAVAKWNTSRVENTVLMGVDFQNHQNKGKEEDNFNFGDIDALNPEYGNFNPLDPANAHDRRINKTQTSLYAQYQAMLDYQWVGVIGGRYDYVKTRNESDKLSQSESRNDGNFSFNAGVMYLSPLGLSPYVSYSESFEVLSSIDLATGKLYKPLEGQQQEVGVKYTPDFFDGYINLAWFDLTQKNALVTNPSTSVQTQSGEVRSKGVELEAAGYVTEDIKLTASYTYTDATTEDTNGQGRKSVALIPRHSASTWINYDAANAGLYGWNFATGVRYIGETKDNPKSSNRTVPSYTLWDAMISYDITPQWQAQINATNLLDKEYISGCDYYCYYGQSRQVVLSANYRW